MLTSKEKFTLKLYSMMCNDSDMKLKKHKLKPVDLLILMEHVRKTQHPMISYDEMIKTIDDIGKVTKELRLTGKAIIKNMPKC